MWPFDITQHRPCVGELFANRDTNYGRIVGYSIDSRMKFRLAVAASRSAVVRRGVLTRLAYLPDNHFASHAIAGALIAEYCSLSTWLTRTSGAQ